MTTDSSCNSQEPRPNSNRRLLAQPSRTAITESNPQISDTFTIIDWFLEWYHMRIAARYMCGGTVSQ